MFVRDPLLILLRLILVRIIFIYETYGTTYSYLFMLCIFFVDVSFLFDSNESYQQ